MNRQYMRKSIRLIDGVWENDPIDSDKNGWLFISAHPDPDDRERWNLFFTRRVG